MTEKAWLDRWNKRFGEDEYAYGVSPNDFLKERLDKLDPGTILFPAEGEGRNAVYAAKSGWTVSAFDISEEGRKKAMKLAEAEGVNVDYRIGELERLDYAEGNFDAIGLIYAHFPPALKSAYHKALADLLHPGGIVILEAFGKRHIEYNSKDPKVGGPNNVEALFSTEEVRDDFQGFEILELEEKEIELNEGLYHIGRGSVVRFVGKKR
ncbi:methyltransferase [Fulvitalea axinellae]|uniref:Methyltransferase n=1 Tax=Fulvitalea axinellae TaxID=1182444 RepID=A0AAU9C7T1_9BACT|nr:methyltransferase [Fulvitalea axinellae]